MMHFKADGHTKYVVEAFKLIAQVKATLTPRMAYRLTRHGTELAIQIVVMETTSFLGLCNEQMNHLFKDDINTFRVDITEKSVERSSQAINLGYLVLQKHISTVLKASTNAHTTVKDAYAVKLA